MISASDMNIQMTAVKQIPEIETESEQDLVQIPASEKLDLFVRFATAEENTTSRNQTLGTGFTVSDIGMDQMYQI